MKNLIMLFIAFITLIGCGGGHQQEENTSEWGDSIATINNTAYYWLQLADDSARISAVRDNQYMAQGNMMTEKYTSSAVKTKSLGLMSETSQAK